jgi:sulfite reductase (NADPH) flavoprotein alpha-component
MAANPSGPVLDVLYASESGNGEDLADQVARRAAGQAGIPIRIRSTAQIDIGELGEIRHLLLIVSTTGLGDVPFDAEDLWNALIAADSPSLEHLRFGVLALGDRVYADFCAAGIEFDDRLAELGALRFADLLTCDHDYEQPAARWLHEAVDAFAGAFSADESQVALSAPLSRPAALILPAPRGRPFRDGALTAATVLSAVDEDREILHYTLALPSSLQEEWRPGDSFELLRPNDPVLVTGIIEQLGLSPDHRVPVRRAEDEAEEATSDDTLTVTELLREHLELRLLSRTLLELVAERTGDAELARLLTAPGDALERWREGRDLLSLLLELPSNRWDATELLSALRPLQPRAYSVASSPLVDPSHVDLTVRTVRYRREDRTLLGTVSGALSERTRPGERIPLRLRPAAGFHLPEDTSADVVMVGPGVGIAPFRGFLQHRERRGDGGRSWLLAGIRDHGRDDLYAAEFARWHREGLLTRYDVATSRSVRRAEYVQHLIARRGTELFEWLAGGATLCVCGDARSMAPAVRLAVQAAATAALGSTEAAASFMGTLEAEGRYLQDVY